MTDREPLDAPESLSEFPKQLGGEPEVMPWDETALPETWPFGASAGTPLRDFSSMTLLRKRAEVVKKNGMGNYFDSLLAAIDAVLTERQGE